MKRSGDEYGTPRWFYEPLDARFHFKLDPCTTSDNPLGTQFYMTKEASGLVHAWTGPVFMNPPYSQVKKWVKRAYEESLKGVLVVGLLRLDPSTRWWNEWVMGKALVWPVPFRIKFVGADSAYNWPNCLVIWHGLGVLRDGRDSNKNRL